MLEILLSIVRAVAALPPVLGALLAPAIARCPPGWYVNGVRPSGIYECRPVLGRPERDISDARARLESGDSRAITGRLRCTGGDSPVVIDSRTVGCRRIP